MKIGKHKLSKIAAAYKTENKYQNLIKTFKSYYFSTFMTLQAFYRTRACQFSSDEELCYIVFIWNDC